jgi:hypothetical protein
MATALQILAAADGDSQQRTSQSGGQRPPAEIRSSAIPAMATFGTDPGVIGDDPGVIAAARRLFCVVSLGGPPLPPRRGKDCCRPSDT